MRIQHIIHMYSLFRSISYSIQLRSIIAHSYEVSWYYIWTLTKELKDLKVYSSSEANSYDMRIQHIIHMCSLFRSISYSIQLRSFIKHSYEVPSYPIWTLMKDLKDLKVYSSSVALRMTWEFSILFTCTHFLGQCPTQSSLGPSSITHMRYLGTTYERWRRTWRI